LNIFNLFMKKKRSKAAKIKSDKIIITLSLSLTLVGLVALADASAPAALSNFSDKYYYVKQQLLAAGVGVLLMFIFSKVNYRLWEKIALPFFILSVVLLILVLIPGVGTKILGARRWFFIGNYSFQPSEIIKLAIAVYFAKLASKDKKPLSYFIPLIAVGFLIMLQPDLGTAISISIIAFSQIFVSGISLYYFLSAIIVSAVTSAILILTSEYRKDRLMGFIQSTDDPLGKSYHIRQVLLALGAGGIWGVGLGQSRQKYLFLPEAATDSIFAVIAEEIGFVGSSILIFFFALFIFTGLKISQNSQDRFGKVLSVGIVAWIGGQAFLNIASMVALIPITGIPLPFFSFGGSSLIAILVASGILANISKYETKNKRL